ncbi:MAG: SPOR domain-containing protein [Rhodocyclaceae bacterium]|nr:SPOR domain-containing protein [Rhodocyclaceae bacterium]
MSDPNSEGVVPVQRGALLKRAAMAGGLIVILLLALGWFERSQAPAPKPAPVLAEAPPPPTDALPPGAPPMPTAAEVEAMIAAQAGEPPPGEMASAELTSAPVLVEAAERVDDAPPPAAGQPRLVLKGEPAVPAPKPASTPAQTATKKPADPPAASVASGDYLVQLGVFSAPGNAETLAGKLDALGVPTHIQSRVVVGPFADRAAADAARDKIQRAGLAKGLVVRQR